jgi:hypothetical protein
MHILAAKHMTRSSLHEGRDESRGLVNDILVAKALIFLGDSRTKHSRGGKAPWRILAGRSFAVDL